MLEALSEIGASPNVRDELCSRYGELRAMSRKDLLEALRAALQ